MDKSVAVVGAGVVGTAIARALQKYGHHIMLFDEAEPGRGTSFGNAGHIATEDIFPLTQRLSWTRFLSMLISSQHPLTIRWQEMVSLAPWLWCFVRASSNHAVEQTIKSLSVLQQFTPRSWTNAVHEEKLESLVKKKGALKIYESHSGYEIEGNNRELLSTQGINFTEMTGADCCKMIPQLKKNIFGAVYFPNSMHTVSPFGVVQSLLHNFTSEGGVFVRERVLSVSRDGSRVVTPAKTYEVTSTIVATGHRSGFLLRPLGFRVPLVSERGYHVMVEHEAVDFAMPLIFFERGLYITPMTEGLRLAGTVEFSPAEKNCPPNWARADLLVAHGQEVLPNIVGEERSRWMGNRPTLPDFLPVLGHAPESRGLVLAFGHQHLGLTLSFATAELISSLVMTGKTSLALSPFNLQRFQ